MSQVDLLREVVRRTKADKPFHIDAWVVLPDHIHAVWTLPEGDWDYSSRWGMIKARFTRELGRSGATPTRPWSPHGTVGGRARGVDERVSAEEAQSRGIPRPTRSESPLWQKRFWEHHIRDEEDYAPHLRYCWWNPVKHGLVEQAEDWAFSSVHRDVGLGVDLG